MVNCWGSVGSTAGFARTKSTAWSRAARWQETDITPLVVTLAVDFSKAPRSVDNSALMAAASWNVCLDNPERRAAGLLDYCLYNPNKIFESLDQTVSQQLRLKRDLWYATPRSARRCFE